ncbi:MAG: hypothetical protein K8R74_17545, partial [Bacteroidales bacterium]|nr:hypothetical protein [Bacteroidales bacterium]
AKLFSRTDPERSRGISRVLFPAPWGVYKIKSIMIPRCSVPKVRRTPLEDPLRGGGEVHLNNKLGAGRKEKGQDTE